MPFVTEEVYHLLQDQSDDLCVKQYADLQKGNKDIIQQGLLLQEVITAIRDARNRQQLKPKETIEVVIQTENASSYKAFERILSKQINASQISFTDQPKQGSITVVVNKDRFFLYSGQSGDGASQKEDLLKDLAYYKGFLAAVDKKLTNEKFVSNAKPEVVEMERKKKEDAEEKIKTIEESLGIK